MNKQNNKQNDDAYDNDDDDNNTSADVLTNKSVFQKVTLVTARVRFKFSSLAECATFSHFHNFRSQKITWEMGKFYAYVCVYVCLLHSYIHLFPQYWWTPGMKVRGIYEDTYSAMVCYGWCFSCVGGCCCFANVAHTTHC